MKNRAYRNLMLGGTAIFLVAPPASAQVLASVATAAATSTAADPSPTAPDQAGGGSQLEEIVVTGEKREGNIQRTPIAITAVSADSLAARNITQINQLDGLVPSLVTPRNGTPYRVISIRGIGSEATQTGSQPSVAYHLDGIYIANPIALGADLLDVARVEVLRGPQGTIFGQAAVGGVINNISNAPQRGKTDGYVQLGYGNYNYLRANAVVNVAVTDTLSIRAAGEHLSHDGYARLVTGYREDDANRWNGRISALWQPTSEFSALIRYQKFHANENGSAQKNINDPVANPRILTHDYPGLYKLDFQMASAELKYDLPWATLKSVSSYQDMKNDNHVDRDRSNVATVFFYDAIPLWHNTYRAYTQEVDISSKPGSRLEWVAGAYYVDYREKQNFVEFAGGGAQPATFNIPANASNGIPANLACLIHRGG